MTRQYRVVWEIDIEADSPDEAARRALQIQRNPESEATVFDVTDSASKATTQVDVRYPVSLRLTHDRDPINWREAGDSVTTLFIVPNRYVRGDTWAKDPNERTLDLVFHRIIYAYAHSGVTVAATPFSCQFDSGPCGCQYITREAAIQTWGKVPDRATLLAAADEELDSFDRFIRGEIYQLEMRRECVYGDTDYVGNIETFEQLEEIVFDKYAATNDELQRIWDERGDLKWVTLAAAKHPVDAP